MSHRKRLVLKKKLKDWLDQRQEALLRMKSRLALVLELESELGRHLVEDKVMVRNHDVYQAASDVYEMMIIDLASFLTGLASSPKGLEQLNNALPILRVDAARPAAEDFAGKATRPGERDQDLHHLAVERYQYRVACFKRLFPNRSAGEKTQRDDVADLKDRVRALVKVVKRARDKFHAHRYEGWTTDGPGRLPAKDVATWFEFAEDLMNCVGIVAFGSSLSYPDSESLSSFDTAQDLVDLMLHGSFALLYEKLGCRAATGADAYYWLLRDRFYAGPAWAAEKSSWKFGGDEGADAC
jgi:hypothetical protein